MPRLTLLALALATLPLAAAPPARTPAPAPDDGPPGLAFAITLGPDGRVLVGQSQTLRIAGASGALRLELTRLALKGGRLTGTARLVNESGGTVLGLRLDVRETTETAEGPGGVQTTRPLPATLREPLVFAPLGPEAASEGQPFEVGPILLAPETRLVIVLGQVSGLALQAAIPLRDVTRPVAIDADASGRLFLADGPGKRILRVPPEGEPAVTVRFDAAARGLAVHRKLGTVHGTIEGSGSVQVVSGGRARPALAAGAPLGPLRFDPDGLLHAAAGPVLLTATRGTADSGTWAARRPLGAEIVSFDLRADGSGCAVVKRGEGTALLLLPVSGSPVEAPTRLVEAASAPSACRIGPAGNPWIVSRGAPGRAPRLVEAGRDGLPVRTVELPGIGDEGGLDLAFGPGRLLYVAVAGGSVLAFRLF